MTGGCLLYYHLSVERSAKLAEEAICRAWEEGRVASTTLRAVDGRAFQVAFPGRRQRGPGPDFRDARLYTEAGELVVGDLEVHCRAADWEAHGHGDDLAYAAVRFHLVAQLGPRSGPAGGAVITFKFEAGAVPLPGWGEPCRAAARRLPTAELREILRTAGRDRLAAKVARVKLWICLLGRDEALFRLLGRAFGYGLPGPGLTLPEGGVGWAGLRAQLVDLPESLRPEHAARLLALPRRVPDRPLVSVRPNNRPDIRLRQLAQLLASCVAGGLWAAFEACFGEPRPFTAVVRLLRARVPSLGAERARVVAVNAVIPAVAAWAELIGNEGLSRKAWAVWEEGPGLGENFITRYLLRRTWMLEGPLPAAEHQGAIQLYHNLCQPGRCDFCPLNEKLQAIL